MEHPVRVAVHVVVIVQDWVVWLAGCEQNLSVRQSVTVCVKH
jgi:hypothetical protein